MGLWLVLAAGLAQAAGIPVVYDATRDTAATVVAQVTQRTGLPAEQLEAVPLSVVLKAPIRAVGAAALRHCTSTPTRMLDVRADMVRAEAALSRADLRGAADQLDLAVAKLACLQELVEPPVAARIFLLRGGLAALEGRPEDATGELRSALSFSPEVTWEDALPPEGAPLLDAARAEAAALTVRTTPPECSSGPWLDGHALAGGLTTRPGLHLVQSASTAGIRSAWMVVGEAETVLVQPESYRAPVLPRVADPARQDEVALLVLAALPAAPAVYVAHGGGLWLVVPDADHTDERLLTVEELITPPPPPPPPPPKLPWWKRLFQRKPRA